VNKFIFNFHSAIISIMFNFRRITMSVFSSIAKAALPMILTVATGGAAAPLVAVQQMAVRAAVQIAIQKLGQELGLPPAIINMAQAFASGQMGGAAGAGQFNAMGSGQNWFNDVISQMTPMAQGMINRALGEFYAAAGDLSTGFSSLDSNVSAAEARYEAVLRNPNSTEREIKLAELDLDKAQGAKINMDKFVTDMFLSQNRKEQEKELKAIMNGKGSLLMKLAMALGSIADQKMSDMATKADQMGKFGEVKGKNQGKFQQLSAELQALGQELTAITSATSNVIKSIGEGAATLARK
jgi:hypothetical protein